MKGRKLSHKEKIAKIAAHKTYRQAIFKELCAHVAKGYSADCFPKLSIVSIRNYLKIYPEEFLQDELDEAMREGKVFWEDIGARQANGLCLGNSRTWYYNMANRFGWREKLDIEAEHKGTVAVNIVSYASSNGSKSDSE
jgi:hypothetical protein